jgi:hypothetical protein
MHIILKIPTPNTIADDSIWIAVILKRLVSSISKR